MAKPQVDGRECPLPSPFPRPPEELRQWRRRRTGLARRKERLAKVQVRKGAPPPAPFLREHFQVIEVDDNGGPVQRAVKRGVLQVGGAQDQDRLPRRSGPGRGKIRPKHGGGLSVTAFLE
jgi:hypothetical protein